MNLTSDYPTFLRPDRSDGQCFYDHIILTVPFSGNYTLVARGLWYPGIDLYYPDFNDARPLSNLVMLTKDSGSTETSVHMILEQNQEYHLILSSGVSLTPMLMELIVRGPQIVNLTQAPRKWIPGSHPKREKSSVVCSVP